MKNLTILLAIIFLTATSSCKKDVYHKVLDSRKPIIPDKDIIVFKSNLGNIDSFQIHVEDYVFTSDNIYHYESFNIYYKKVNCNNSSNKKDTLMCDEGMMYTIPYENKFSGVQVPGFFKAKFRQVIVLNISSDSYENVNKMIDTSNNLNSYNFYTIYASDKYGILRYDYVSGEYYELIKK